MTLKSKIEAIFSNKKVSYGSGFKSTLKNIKIDFNKGNITINKRNKVDKQINLTSGVQGMNTSQNYVPRVKNADITMKNHSLIDEFKNFSFNPKRKTNIKLKI